jgi:hypothetical protein
MLPLLSSSGELTRGGGGVPLLLRSLSWTNRGDACQSTGVSALLLRSLSWTNSGDACQSTGVSALLRRSLSCTLAWVGGCGGMASASGTRLGAF